MPAVYLANASVREDEHRVQGVGGGEGGGGGWWGGVLQGGSEAAARLRACSQAEERPH